MIRVDEQTVFIAPIGTKFPAPGEPITDEWELLSPAIPDVVPERWDTVE